ncbi:hypothetical protein [Candidatus Cyanaurora vandensis]|uniref:hypothetical protein n=1 Tax=Candidatus Cyanaurora vandensis TaxID=2714958 RepID=UPI00257A134F|nr:hypothetical protein [Candidatus Cyanaurora vandensis]
MQQGLLLAVIGASLGLSALVKYILPQWITGYTTGGLWAILLGPVLLIAFVLVLRQRKTP